MNLKPIKKRIKKYLNDIIDLVEYTLFIKSRLIPPRNKIFIGNGDYLQIGNEFLSYFIEKGQLQINNHVLDIGCGSGRMALPLTKYLAKDAQYEGIDIVKEGIDWCQKKFTSKYQNFHFLHTDIYNKLYNPEGKFKSSDYKFPYQESSFDFIFLTSVFTHMLSEDIENYLEEISRVLKPGGRCFITYFLLNDESLNNMKSKPGRFSFKYKSGESFIDNQEVPEAAIAYNEVFIRNLYLKNKLKIEEPIQYGSWCGRDKYLSFQDIIIAVKE